MSDQQYVKVGNNALPFTTKNANGLPSVKTWSEIRVKPDGTKQHVVHVPCLRIVGGTKSNG